jgi:ABC-type dipeptide/oligopeptide/nickel transport system permease component
MIRFFLGKLAYVIPTFFGITLVAFGFVRVLPGDPVLLLAGERGLTPERYEMLLHQLGFDRPLWQQYVDYLWKLAHGDLFGGHGLKRYLEPDPDLLHPSCTQPIEGAADNSTCVFHSVY